MIFVILGVKHLLLIIAIFFIPFEALNKYYSIITYSNKILQIDDFIDSYYVKACLILWPI